MARERRRRLLTAALLAAVIGLGAWLRLDGLGAWHYSGDDLLHLELAERPGSVNELLGTVHLTDAHPPLYYLSLYALRGGLGGPVAPRLPSLVLGLLLIPLWYLLGARAGGGRAGGLVMAATAAAGTVLVAQSQTIRQYSMLLVALTAMLLCAQALRAGRRRWLTFAGYLGFGAVAIATHHAACVVIAAVAVAGLPAVLAEQRRRRALAAWAGAHALLAVCFLLIALPYLALAGFGTPKTAYITRALISDWDSFVRQLLDVPRLIFAVDARARWLAAAPLALGAWAAWRRRRPEPLLLAATGLSLALALAVAGLFPLVGMRWSAYLLVCLVPLAALGVQHAWDRAGAAADARLRVAGRVAVLGALAALAAVNLDTPRLPLASADGYRSQGWDFDFTFRVADHDAALGHVLANGRAGDVILVSEAGGRRIDFDLRHRQRTPAAAAVARFRVARCRDYELTAAAPVADCLRRLRLGAGARVWLVEYDPQGGAPLDALALDPAAPRLGRLALPLDAGALLGGGAVAVR